MFVLRTGLQGNGKTLNTIKEVDQKAAREGRAVYYHNIRGFKPDSDVLQAVWQEFDDPHQWFTLPDNSIIVIDEAQTFFRIRKPTAAVPAYASALETMRHRGHELHCITQSPGLIDHHFRKLCNAHIHYVRGHKGKVIKRWEFERVNTEVEKKNHFSEGESTRILLDKKYFEVYQSVKDSVDHHMRFKPPKALWVLAGCFVLMLWLGFSLYRNRIEPAVTPDSALKQEPFKGVTDFMGPVSPKSQTLTLDEYLALRTPRLSDVPSSAPLYDPVTAPVTYPRLSCIYTDSQELLARNERFTRGTWKNQAHGCFCNTQQGTLAMVSFDACMNYAKNGAFDPARPEPQLGQPQEQQQGERTGGRVSRREPANAAPHDVRSHPALPAGTFGMLTSGPVVP